MKYRDTKFAARLCRWTIRLSIRLRPQWAAVLWSTLCNNRCNRECTFFSLPCHAGTCAHTDSAVLTDTRDRARYTLSQNFTSTTRHTTDYIGCRLLIVGRHARRTSIISKTKKKSHESIVTAEKVIPPLFFLLRCRKTTPTLFRV